MKIKTEISSLVILLLLFLFKTGNCQNEIDVADITLKVGGMSTTEKYFGFAEGDKIIFNMSERDKKEIKEVTITEYPNSIKFQDRSISKIENKTLNVSKKVIYKFSFYNSNISGRIILLSLKRIPGNLESKDFNTNVVFRNVIDTTIVAEQKQFLISSDTSIVEVINTNAMVHNLSKTITDFTLPENTISYAYWIGVGDESQKAFKKDQDNVISSGAKFLSSINPLAGLLVGALALTKSNVGENVEYWFIPDNANALLFKSNQQFQQYKKGNIITDYGVMKPKEGRQFLGFYNDNYMQDISVNLKVTAMVVKNNYETRTVQVPIIKNIEKPFNE